MTVHAGIGLFASLLVVQLGAVCAMMLWLRAKEDVPCDRCHGDGVTYRLGTNWTLASTCTACHGTGVRGR